MRILNKRTVRPTTLKSERSLFTVPDSLSASATATHRSQIDIGELADVFKAMEPPALVDAFVAQDVRTVSEACELGIDEVRIILSEFGIAPKVGLVRRIISRLQLYDKALRKVEQQADELAHVAPTPSSILSRTMLSMSSTDLKDSLVARLTAESVFASLMLTIAVAALLATPTAADTNNCAAQYSEGTCDALNHASFIVWGLTSAFFLVSCTVGLGAIQLFVGVSTSDNVHFMLVKAEQYMNLSFTFISGGFIGLMCGICLVGFVKFAQYPAGCWIVVLGVWALWGLQFVRALDSVKQVYSNYPGFNGVAGFMGGYFTFSNTLKPNLDHGHHMHRLPEVGKAPLSDDLFAA